MPNLPTVTVTDAQATRILAVYGDAATYKAWLIEQIRAHVLTVEMNALESAHAQARLDKQAQVDAELPVPEPPVIP